MGKPAVYDQFDKAFGSVTAYAIIHMGVPMGRVVLKHGAAVTAYVQIWGAEMQKGIARGGNYDRATAAVEAAVAKLAQMPEPADPHAALAKQALQNAIATGPDGTRWTDLVERGGLGLGLVIG